MKPKTQELLYFLLWACQRLAQPSWRNVTESFEAWEYRNGFNRQLAALERKQLLESQKGPNAPGSMARVVRLTEAGRLQALGGRDPEICWRRAWDGQWRVVLFDIPNSRRADRNRLRKYLRAQGFGHLQNSAWISPHPLENERAILKDEEVDAGSLVLLDARPCAGETDEEIVNSAWNFAELNGLYRKFLKLLEARPKGQLRTVADAERFQRWAQEESSAWLEVVSKDPLLPGSLAPQGYVGRQAWRTRIKVLQQASEQIASFRMEPAVTK